MSASVHLFGNGGRRCSASVGDANLVAKCFVTLVLQAGRKCEDKCDKHMHGSAEHITYTLEVNELILRLLARTKIL